MAPPPPHPLPPRPPTQAPGRPAPAAQEAPAPAPGISLPPRPGWVPTPLAGARHGAATSTPALADPPPSAPAPRTPSLGGQRPGLQPSLSQHRTAPAAAAPPPPWPGVRPPLRPQDASTTAQLVELGDGWHVYYRAWKAPAHLFDPPAVDPPDRLDWNPLAPASLAPGGAPVVRSPASSAAGASTDEPPAKKAKKGPAARGAGGNNAFDDLLAEEMLAVATPTGGASLSLATPLASPSLLPPLAPPGPAPLPAGRVPAVLKAAQAAAAASAASTPAPPRPDQAPPSTTNGAGADPVPAAARLRAHLAAVDRLEHEALAAAQKEVERRAALVREEGKDRLALISWVRSAVVHVGEPHHLATDDEGGKGKSKAKEATTEAKRERGGAAMNGEAVEGEGRTLWVFGVVRGGDAEGDAVALDEFAFAGLEPFASGDFTHASLHPALYSSTASYTAPLSLPANAYPSALALSSKLLSIPLIAQPPPAQTPLQAAYEAFRRAFASILLDELVAHPPAYMRCLRASDAVVYLPVAALDRAPSGRPVLAPQPALRLALAPVTVGRSALQLHSTLTHVPLCTLPASASPQTPVRLAPLDVPATLLRAVRFSPARREQLEAVWAPHVTRAAGSCVGDAGFVLCALDAPAAAGADRLEVVWPRALVLVDAARAPAPLAPAQGVTPAPPNGGGASGAASLAKRAGTGLAPPCAEPGARVRVQGDAPLRARLAGQVLRCRGGIGAAGAAPRRRRTGDVWSWMGEEQKRREEEKENAARREADKVKEGDGAPPPTPLSQAKEDDKAPVQPPAAAPINMRTPMSLGTSSTEAPSPAELFALQPGHAALPTAPQAAPEQAHDTLQGMDIDFGLSMYPSPAEPGTGASIAPAPAASSAPMSTLDAAFSEFDWGDGTFGTGGMDGGNGRGRSGGGGPNSGAFDDGMMLGLTDDDFSFFDAPTPAPASALGNSLALSMPPPLVPAAEELGFSAMPVVPGIDAAFDLFASTPADMAGATSANPILVSTTSPQFPHGASPALPFSFGAFEPLTPNALELAHGSPAAPLSGVAPFSPIVLASAANTPASFVPTTYPSSFTPAVLADTALQPSPGGHATVRLCAFDPVAFDPAHAALDDKYDPRRGKFGLPSPDSDHEGRALVRPDAVAAAAAARSWYETVCDPRVALAQRLRRQRLGAPADASAGTFRGAAAASQPRPWLRKKTGAPLGALVEGWSPSTAQLTADEAESEQSSSDSDRDDAMDVDNSVCQSGAFEGEPGEVNDRVLEEAFGTALLAGGVLLERCIEPAGSPPGSAAPEAGKADPARDLKYHVVTEHLTFLPDLRAATLAFSPRSKRSDPPVPAQALASVSTALAGVCSALSPSPLFADHTVLAPLVEEAPPAFLLRAQQCVIETSRAAVDFWRPMGFEPLPGAKNVTAFAVYEDSGAEVHETVREWLRMAGSTYEGLRLGSHTPGTVSPSGNFAGIQDGLVPLSAGLLSTNKAREELKFLYAALSDASKLSQNTVVYLVAPLDDSPFSNTSPLAGIIHQVSKSRHGASPVNMLPCAVPMSSIVPSPSITARLARLAFSVYDQLQVAVERLRFPMPETFPSARPPPLAPLGPAVRLFPAPAINIAPPPVRRVQFSLSWPPTALEVEHRHRLLQVCYGSRRLSEDSGQECLVVTTVDERGESWKVAPRLIKIPVGAVADVQRVRLVWSFVKSLVDAVDVEWRVILCKLGEPTGLEAKTWDSLLKEYLAVARRPIHVTFACAELDPAVAVVPLPGRPSASSEDVKPAVTGETLFEASPSTFTFTPSEPVSPLSLPLTPAASTYFFHIPRLSSHAHAPLDLLTPCETTATSSYGLHFFLSHASRTSVYKATLGALVADVRRSFVELAALGQARWGTSGRLAWHVEATGFALLLADQLS